MVIDIDGLKQVNDRLGHQPGDNLIRRVADDPARTGARHRPRRPPLRRRVRGADAADRRRRRDAAGRGPAGPGGRGLRRRPELGRRRSASGSRCSAASATSPPRRSWSPPTRRCTGRRRRGATGSRCSVPGRRAAATPAADDQREDPRRAHPGPPAAGDAADPQPRHGRHRALRAAAADARRERRAVPGGPFIGVAERSGMVQELDRWVVGQALELLAERQRAGDPVSLHVNLSGASLTDLSVLEFIERRLDEGEADPARCTFEITQTARVEDLDTAAELRRPADRVRLRSRDRRLRRRLRPLRVPEALPLRRDQDRRHLRPRHAPQRRRPAHRAGDRRDRPRASASARSPSSSRTRTPR